MENKEFKNTGSVLDHCRICKCKLYIWEDDGAICGYCLEGFIDQSKKDYKTLYMTDGDRD